MRLEGRLVGGFRHLPQIGAPAGFCFASVSDWTDVWRISNTVPRANPASV